jgi:hypothetical protein
MDAAVLTITGLCDNSNADETAPSKCATVITRADFEKLVAAIQPNMTAHARREFALNYANALVMARKAEQMGLDKGPFFDEQMRVARIDILSKELKKAMQKEALQTSDSEINRYYDENTSSFEEAEMERIYVPRTQDVQAAPDQTAAEAGKPKESKPFETSMKEFAGKLRARGCRRRFQQVAGRSVSSRGNQSRPQSQPEQNPADFLAAGPGFRHGPETRRDLAGNRGPQWIFHLQNQRKRHADAGAKPRRD